MREHRISCSIRLRANNFQMEGNAYIMATNGNEFRPKMAIVFFEFHDSGSMDSNHEAL